MVEVSRRVLSCREVVVAKCEFISNLPNQFGPTVHDASKVEGTKSFHHLRSQRSRGRPEATPIRILAQSLFSSLSVVLCNGFLSRDSTDCAVVR